MMALNCMRFFRFCARTFNHIGINRALSQPFRIVSFACFRLEHFHKFRPNNFTLLLRVSNACQFAHKIISCIHMNHIYPQIASKHIHYHLTFI